MHSPRPLHLLVLLLAIGSSIEVIAQSSLANETGNNTSACSSANAPCTAAFGSMTDTQTPAAGSTVLTPTYNIAPPAGAWISTTAGGYVSKLNPRNVSGFMPYSPNSATKLFVHLMPWFGTSSHINVGYSSNNTSQVQRQLADMASRGFDGVAIDWYGEATSTAGCLTQPVSLPPVFNSACSTDRQSLDGTALKVAANVSSNGMLLAVVEDQGAYTTAATCDTGSPFGPSGTDKQWQPGCHLAKLEADMDYANLVYFGNTSYYKVNGRPVVFTFVSKPAYAQCITSAPCNITSSLTCTSQTDCWTKVWDNLIAHVQGYSNGTPMIIFKDAKPAFPEAMNGTSGDGGAFAWISLWQNCDPSRPGCTTGAGPITNCTQLDEKKQFGLCSDTGKNNYIDDFYSTLQCTYTGSGCTIGELALGSAYKGFDDSGWVQPIGKVIAQRCGQTWLDSWTWPSDLNSSNAPYFSSAHPLNAIQVVTWNDYEEGSEIETGIDNCVQSVSEGAPDVNTGLSWTISFNDTTYGSSRTFDHFTLFYSTDGGNTLNSKQDIPLSNCSGSGPVNCSIPLNSLSVWPAGTYSLYIKEVSKPSIINHMSAAVTFTPSVVTLSPSPVAFGSVPTNTTANQTVTVTNTGSYNVQLGSFTITTNPSNVYGVSNIDCPTGASSLAPGAACHLNVSFTPNAASTFNGTLTVSHNGANASTTDSLSGTGGCTVNCGSGTASFNLKHLDFGSQAVNTTSTAQAVTLTNVGSGSLAVSLSTTGDFQQTNNCPASLGAGSSCTVNVTFTPTAIQTRTGTLTANGVSLWTIGVGGALKYSNIDALSGWTNVASGTGVGTLTQNVASPSLDGGSAQFGYQQTTAFSDVNWENVLTFDGTLSKYTLYVDAYLTDATIPQALEFGVSHAVGGNDYPFKFQCDFKDSKLWRIWDEANQAWLSTSLACSSSQFPANTWVHLSFDFQRTSGNQLNYQQFTIASDANGVTTTSVNLNANPSAETNNLEVHFKQFGPSTASTSYTVWIDKMNVAAQ
jgi:hypothetical protein